MDCILEDSVTIVTPGVATSFCDTRGGGRRGSRIPSGNASRRGSVDSGDTPINSDTFTYWLQVCVDPSVSCCSHLAYYIMSVQHTLKVLMIQICCRTLKKSSRLTLLLKTVQFKDIMFKALVTYPEVMLF